MLVRDSYFSIIVILKNPIGFWQSQFREVEEELIWSFFAIVNIPQRSDKRRVILV